MSKNDEQNYIDEKPIYNKDGNEYSIVELQQMVVDNKLKKGFNTTDPWKDVVYLVGEFGEMAEAIRNPDREDLVEAIVDMCIHSFGLFQMYKVNGYDYIVRKMIVNENRAFVHSKAKYMVRADRSEKTPLNTVRIPRIMENLSIQKIQDRIVLNKKNKGFNTDPKNIEKELLFIAEEFSEIVIALRKGYDEDFLDALTDIVIYMFGLFGMMKLDGYKLITKKINLNKNRVYKKIVASGDFVREDQ